MIHDDPRLRRPAGMIGGFAIMTSTDLTEYVVHARSPSRAKRRAQRGFPQNMVWRPSRTIYRLPRGVLLMHPAMLDELRKEISK